MVFPEDWRYDVVGIGNALVDSLVVLDEPDIASTGFRQGIMHVVDASTWDAVYRRFLSPAMQIHAGGSCPNTLATLGLLGARTLKRGQVGDDELGRLYLESLATSCDASAMKVKSGVPTGRCLSLVRRDDGERTMLTCLGGAIEMDDLGPFEDAIRHARILHLTGYPLLQPPIRDAALAALETAREAGVSVSLDVADPFVIRAIRDDVWRVIRDYCDVVFLNAEEATELCEGLPPERAVHEVGRFVETVVVKLGSRGSLVKCRGVVTPIGIHRVRAVDTTGAGDAFAGGFLYGLTQDWAAPRCGRLGARVAALTVSQLGAVHRDPVALREAVRACEETP
jgi:hypothetical protein